MKEQKLLLVFVLIVTIVFAGSVALAAGSSDRGDPPLAQQVMQKSDLPEQSQAYYTKAVTEDRFPGPLCPVNIPLQTEGFLRAHEASAWYPFSVNKSALRNAVQDEQGGAFILNVVYEYQDEAQAAAALEQQLEWFHRGDIAADAQVETVNDNTIKLTYSQKGQTWVTYWFFGVKGNTLKLLMVDGSPVSTTHEVFDSLRSSLVQR